MPEQTQNSRFSNPGQADAATAQTTVNAVIDALDGVLSCGRAPIELAVTTLAAGGHLLLEDVPGVGKTTLARALGTVIQGSVRRVQFTPDMLPSDLTGVSIYDQSTQRFNFHPGPLFANIVVADEINRANPKTQSAMLEAMAEGQISVDGVTYRLPDPYFVVATQNPIELEGTFPLPEAQLDRFMACTSLGYPSAVAEAATLTSEYSKRPLSRLKPVCDVNAVAAVQDAADRVHLSDSVANYIVAITTATRRREDVKFGASPRASLFLAAMAKAHALIAKRDFVLADDVRSLAVPVLAHRLVLPDAAFGTGGTTGRSIVEDIVAHTPVPHIVDRR
ncbi:AAA family ATPase [Bifidobacterium avesanii]|uniref:AAA domain-containing protein n=1 Tax=Bifidobacterium avesanii TaxID=1798157 RepID=A0A7K3THE3_9BIFI|nr:MoxR family ATPase [Bifidobacterium avesanii]KAB8292654.1 MoxR-like ATPase [Bifidobacterium avesanii]NEG78518.1 AAA domain-containing protein [Bifidobacterium avesanii]